ncbi:type II toxin-antitoxin system RelE/ParE family toxin [Scytonema hofmannii FACHB-248]|uniref:Type II toxin-antitoxin system RelE/ParE family toxin n=1 Tax=Scytonema hofmannii FACHB-248 TaxID=1842502 RepID=A0ABR8H236_9CYAN|nr:MULTISPECIES: type II toxin-antitoxin system RelE/ParE family toxin [Nostocales]MBD2609402.1 type II toxin-antitoxin system RelE/ParE family toxin [Scytonema hofmannii FACHB-248]
MAYNFHPDAKQELDDAVAYYDNISRDMGDAFIAEVERTLNRIEQFPQAWTQSRMMKQRSHSFHIIAVF